MRILIIGGGFAGLTLAALLRQSGHAPVVIEKSPRYEPMGYVIGLWPLGSRILHGLNLYEKYQACSLATPHHRMYDRSGSLLQEFDVGSFFDRYGSLRCVTRHELLQVLLEGAGASNVRMGITPESIEQSEKEVHVRFSDGTEGNFDFVAGCDGIHSRTRRLLFGDLPLRETGWAGWAWWMDPALVPAQTIIEYYGPGRYVGIFPAKGKTCCFSGLPCKAGHRDQPETRAVRIREAYGDFRGAMPEILKGLPPPDQISFTRFADIYLQQWSRGRVLLLGDAGQGILPTAGIGASAAMESAAVLADELTHADASTVGRAIENFTHRRRKRVDHIQAESWKLARFVFNSSALSSWLMNRLMKFYSTERLLKGFIPMLEEPV
jgi:2-polyprenyl-6-methoxyphenol hydroxylase-like FAD-dependent oxidoreductase